MNLYFSPKTKTLWQIVRQPSLNDLAYIEILQVIHCRGYLKIKHQSIGGDLPGSFEPGFQEQMLQNVWET